MCLQGCGFRLQRCGFRLWGGWSWTLGFFVYTLGMCLKTLGCVFILSGSGLIFWRVEVRVWGCGLVLWK